MLKIRSILPTTFSILKERLRLCAKISPKSVINLPNALGTTIEEAAVKSINNVLECNLPQSGKSLAITQITQKRNFSAASAEKQHKGCNKKDATKGKKGKYCGQPKPPPPPPQKNGPPGGNTINDKCDIYEIPKTNSKKWRNISFCLITFVIGLTAFVFTSIEERPEPDYIPYEYMYKRTKRFAWGDGKKTFFHGRYNLIPEEEEARIDRKGPGEGPRYKKRSSE